MLSSRLSSSRSAVVSGFSTCCHTATAARRTSAALALSCALNAVICRARLAATMTAWYLESTTSNGQIGQSGNNRGFVPSGHDRAETTGYERSMSSTSTIEV